ncbi:ankyrin repeat domain-containing protein [Chamaesiphon minutus]|uniref:Ankyrin repeat-containing protein n=1 Tax=Chamaesiphon minutus (strain ATCC 27169 / PCC 6605) TaxID=1173020 RepID=K9UPF5_CHAP6|nr:ankyrin repeat domain-containing protein [Chamaesiphon minutus]AFY96700.1 ankyrin repeat-containing protein [Chamaesiphon minutus PCC 6605]
MSVDPKTQSLFDAIAANNHPRVKLLIDAGVNINTPNDRGQTPLAVACRQGNLEIINLLIAAGAQMQAQPEPIPPAQTDREQPIASESETLLPPTSERQISFENLLELIDRPIDANVTQVEQIMPIAELPLGAQVLPPPTELERISSNWQDISTDAEATYTFDLDAVFAANEAANQRISQADPDMFVENESTMTSIERPASEVEFESGETYAFDLSPELDRLTSESLTTSERLSVPMGEWGDTETYVMENFSALAADIDISSSDDRDDLLGIGTIPMELFGLDEHEFMPSQTWEDGETYAIDLEDLDSMELHGNLDLAVKTEPHLLSDLDSSLFPVIGGEDEPDYDPDTQTSTDIFGQSSLKQNEREEDLARGYEENSTNTSLMAAAIDGDLDLVQQAIEAGANLDRYDWNLGYSPLGMAIDRGHLEIVQCLLTAGCNPHCGSTTITALGLAAECGEVEMIQMLLPRGVDVNAPVGADGWTALLSAISKGHRAVVQLLVTAGANVNVWSRGETPILLAAKCEEREIYQYLYPLVNTAIRLCADRDGEQLLQSTRKRRIREQNRPIEKFIEMATIGNIDEVNRAIEIGIEVDEIGAKGHTALMAAAYHGHRSIVNILLSAGADPNLLSDDNGLGTAGLTALMLAAGSFFASNRQQIVQLAIAGGADVNQRGAGGRTAIFYAALAGSGYTDCVETLIAAGADLEIQDDLGHTVLSSVAAAENYQMFNLLMQAGASTSGLESIQLIQAAGAGNVERVKSLLATNAVNLDLDRGAAIGNAAAAGHTNIVELLIRAGANVNLRDKLGFTPISSAAYAGYGEIVQLLIDAGADIQAPAGSSHGSSQSYSALEYAQMGLYQFDRDDLQHAQIIRQLQQLGAR